jgi:hypothetical protein
MAISKVVYGGDVLIDLTSDTVVADKLLNGYKAHGADGNVINGSCTFDADTQDATATAAEILTGKTAYNKGNKVTGAMKNNGAVSGTISTKTGVYTVPQGYHDGSGKVAISSAEQAKLIAPNIRQGITILGVVGAMSPNEGEKAQEKTVTPSTSKQTIVPDAGYTCLSSVTVNAIPYVESENSAGGTTVTIG